MFYFAELAALAVCWLFYTELYWFVRQKASDACGRNDLNRHLIKWQDHLFFSPVSARAHLGLWYYVNIISVSALTVLTGIHLLLGWWEPWQGFIRTVTTLLAVALGVIAVSVSSPGVEKLCAGLRIRRKRTVRRYKIALVLSEVLAVLLYLYFAWAYIR